MRGNPHSYRNWGEGLGNDPSYPALPRRRAQITSTNARPEGAQGLAVDHVTEAVAGLDTGKNTALNQYVSGVYRFGANCDLAPGRRHPRAMAAHPRRISTGCLVSQSVGMAPDHAATGQLPPGRYDSASTKAAPETTDESSCILWICKEFHAFRPWLIPHPTPIDSGLGFRPGPPPAHSRDLQD